MTHRLFPALFCVAIVINALWFTAYAAIPLPSSDAWFFIDNFVRKGLEGQLALADFFVQRHAGDHAQPVQKLVLLVHMAWADLDFRIEALVGIVFAAATCAVLAGVLIGSARGAREKRRAWWGALAIFAVGLSFNSTMTYTWSLVALSWILLLVAIAYWLAVSVVDRAGAKYLLLMGVLTFVVAIVTDELAFPIFAAAFVALIVRDGPTRLRRGLLFLVAGAIGLLAGRWLIHAMSGSVAEATAGSPSELVGTLTSPGAWKLVVGPLADSLVHQRHLVAWFPKSAGVIQIAIAGMLVLLHGVFWMRVLDPARRPEERVLVVAVACMLFFYAAIFGIALSRVGSYGIEYVHQPRYVVIYALNLVALLLVFFAPPGGSDPVQSTRWHGRLGSALAAAVLLLQVPLVHAGWKEAPFVRAYAHRSAEALAIVARDPAADTSAAGCPPTLPICNAPAEVRIRTIELLRRHELSLFSPRFRARHAMEDVDIGLGAQAIGTAAASARNCRVTILKRGPTEIPRGVVERGGPAAFWLTLPAGAPAFRIEFEGEPVSMNRRDGVATFRFDERQAAAVRDGRPLRYSLVCEGAEVGAFDVAIH